MINPSENADPTYAHSPLPNRPVDRFAPEDLMHIMGNQLLQRAAWLVGALIERPGSAPPLTPDATYRALDGVTVMRNHNEVPKFPTFLRAGRVMQSSVFQELDTAADMAFCGLRARRLYRSEPAGLGKPRTTMLTATELQFDRPPRPKHMVPLSIKVIYAGPGMVSKKLDPNQKNGILKVTEFPGDTHTSIILDTPRAQQPNAAILERYPLYPDLLTHMQACLKLATETCFMPLFTRRTY